MQNNDKDAIRQVIEKAYIEGIHTTQDENVVRNGIHKDFAMLVYKGDNFEKVTIDMWLKRIERSKKENPDLWSKKSHYDSMIINVTNYAASAVFNLFKGNEFYAADFMLLYKFNDGWKIVSKIFSLDQN